jgi:hypothetical protein
MFISSKNLPVLALAVVLSPLAAQAQSNPQPGLAQLTPSSATIENPVPAGLWDGRLSGQTGANCAGGGNRYSYTEPTAIARTDPVPAGLWDGRLSGQTGANSVGGGNRYSYTGPTAVAGTDPAPIGLWDGQLPERTGANIAGGGNR